MMRNSLDASSRGIFIGRYAGGTNTLYRTADGTTSSLVTTPNSGLYRYTWVKLVRTGNNFLAYTCADGVGWILAAGPIPMSMGNTIFVGLVTTGAASSGMYTGTLDNVSVTTTATSTSPVIIGTSTT